MAKLKVLLTGATGYVAGQLLPELRERYDLRLIDVRQTNRAGETVAGVEVVDALNAPDEQLVPYFAGTDIVMHLGYVRPVTGTTSAPGTFPTSPDPQQVYDGERRNVDMMQRVFALALKHGVRRVVAASTNQAAKWYEQPYYQGLRDRVTPEDYPRPDTFYGWAKVAYESLGFLYACGSLGRKLEVVLIRIVAPRDLDPAVYAGQPKERYIRDLAGYVSPRDLTQLFVKSVETPEIADEFGVPFHIFYGVSNNARTFWSITNARKVIGYAPIDDSEQRFAADIAKLLHG
jgi:nucleoside-diphosphate-sugar epimerase